MVTTAYPAELLHFATGFNSLLKEKAYTSLQRLLASPFLMLLVMLTTAVHLAASIELTVFSGKC